MRNSVVGVVVLGIASVIACSGANTNGFPDGGTTTGFNGGSGSSSGSGGGSGGSSSGVNLIGSSSSGSSSGGTGDAGFVCAPNPLNYEIPGNNCDDDGDGTKDNPPVACDKGTLPAGLSGPAFAAADMMAALGLCQAADATHWGVVSAVYTNGYGSTAAGSDNFGSQHNVMTKFGNVVVPREGSALGVLSSGTADTYDTKDVSAGDTASTAAFKGNKNGMQSNSGNVPNGFPKPANNCPKGNGVHDVIDLKVQLKVPANAQGFSFDFDFWSGEWPEYVCTAYNDSFIAYLKSTAFNGGSPDNISFDSKGNPVSVNVGFFGVCTPGVTCLSGTASVCSAGPGDLAGTGFDDPGNYCLQQSTGGGATGWLTSTAPAKPGETISIDFIIWDTGDNQYDSSVLLDNWVWQPQEVAAVPITQPAQPPK